MVTLIQKDLFASHNYGEINREISLAETNQVEINPRIFLAKDKIIEILILKDLLVSFNNDAINPELY